MHFKRLYELRTDNNMTQQQIANYLICKRQVYARYEQGVSLIPVEMLVKLAKLYNVSIDYIVGLSDKP